MSTTSSPTPVAFHTTFQHSQRPTQPRTVPNSIMLARVEALRRQRADAQPALQPQGRLQRTQYCLDADEVIPVTRPCIDVDEWDKPIVVAHKGPTPHIIG